MLIKSGSGTFQLTERDKWALKQFVFLHGHILRKALMHTARFFTSSSQMRLDESRGSGTDTDVENRQALSQ